MISEIIKKYWKFVLPPILLITLLFVAIAILFLLRAWWAFPFPVFGMGEPPEQPINYPHKVHVEDMGMQCEFCHREVTQGEAATVPAVEQCMWCHKDLSSNPGEDDSVYLGGKNNIELEKLRQYWEQSNPINWARVHRLPDHVQFKHESHIRYFTEVENKETSEVCTICHGNVGSMEKVRQFTELKMSDCVNCHRKHSAPTDCVACHY